MSLLRALQALANPARSRQMADYHKVSRIYLGVSNPAINALAAQARRGMTVAARITEAGELWHSNIHECRILAAKLFEHRRIESSDMVWALICSWVAEFDAWAIADHVAKSGSFRLVEKPARLSDVETWTTKRSLWVRRAALVMTLPWARMADASADDLACRERILGWAGRYAGDPEWFIQKCVAWWLRELSTKDPERVLRFVSEFGSEMSAFARKEALRNL